MKPKCETCLFFKPAPEVGKCHRHPPVAPHGVLPNTDPESVCGDGLWSFAGGWPVPFENAYAAWNASWEEGVPRQLLAPEVKP